MKKFCHEPEHNEKNIYHEVSMQSERPVDSPQYHSEAHRAMLFRRGGVYIIHHRRASMRAALVI